jgi:hypothetical protein
MAELRYSTDTKTKTKTKQSYKDTTMFKWLALTSLLLLAACTDPIIGVPGGKLKGELSPLPDTWSSVPDVIQVEFRPSDPYSINIWAVVDGGNIHLATTETKWVPFLEANNLVTVRIEGKLYELQAQKLDSEEGAMSLAAAYIAKYEYEMPDDWTELNAYRLVARH